MIVVYKNSNQHKLQGGSIIRSHHKFGRGALYKSFGKVHYGMSKSYNIFPNQNFSYILKLNKFIFFFFAHDFDFYTNFFIIRIRILCTDMLYKI